MGINLNRWTRLIKLLCIMIVLSTILTGCWDRLEIEDRAVVLGVSIDVAKPEAEGSEGEITHLAGSLPAPATGRVRVGVQIALPGRIPLGPGESGGGGKGGGSQTVWVIDVKGYSIDDAFMNLQQQVSSKLFFGHLRVIVVSEAMAKKGLENVNDYFRRDSEVRRMAWLMISKGKALQFLKAAPQLERVPTLYLMSTLDQAIKTGKFPTDYIGTFWSNSSKKGQEGFLPYMELKKEQNVEILGLALFKDDKMVGKTAPLEIGAYMGIKGINPAGYRVFISQGAQETVMTVVTFRHSKTEVQIKDNHPHFKITIGLEMNLEEKLTEQLSINNLNVIHSIERRQEEGAKKAFMNLIKKTQTKESDIFGFGEYVRAKEPRFWNKQIRTTKAWQDMYKDVTFDFSVSVRMRRIGMKAK